jgi:hypothetical protein
MTFESLCRKHKVTGIDLIHVDADGYDFEVIKLIAFAFHRPLVLLYEHKHLSPVDHAACRAYRNTRGYESMEDGADTVCLQRDAIVRPLSPLGRAWRIMCARLRPATGGCRCGVSAEVRAREPLSVEHHCGSGSEARADGSSLDQLRERLTRCTTTSPST